ncbi:hypothetical protein CG719_30365 [Streptomyces sp. CB01373]|nr:hypothetical protein [Streptomyces sp. CB01373]PJM92131.1 hypothetical protein CG719_30365 [Streptomyces sp. CB01373]
MPGTLPPGSEGLSKLCRKERAVVALVQAAAEEGVRVATSALTTLEADYERIPEDLTLLCGPSAEVVKA